MSRGATRAQESKFVDNVMVYANSEQSYCVAVVDPNDDALLAEAGGSGGSLNDLYTNSDLVRAVLADIKVVGKKVRSCCLVHCFDGRFLICVCFVLYVLFYLDVDPPTLPPKKKHTRTRDNAFRLPRYHWRRSLASTRAKSRKRCACPTSIGRPRPNW